MYKSREKNELDEWMDEWINEQTTCQKPRVTILEKKHHFERKTTNYGITHFHYQNSMKMESDCVTYLRLNSDREVMKMMVTTLSK